MNHEPLFHIDKDKKQISVDRDFDAPLDLVWSAWTEAEILDQWWAPKPWRMETKTMDFRDGGLWHYAMVSPGGEKHWCLFEYSSIQPHRSFDGIDAFCDENLVISNAKPRVKWGSEFEAKGERTTVHIQMNFESLEGLETIIAMGFREGFTMGLSNLDTYLSEQLE